MERLRQIREQAGYSQQDLADESGVSQHTISEIELGRRKPQGRTLRKLAKVLGVEVRDFFEVASRPLAQAPPEKQEYGALLEDMGFSPEQIESWRTQEGHDNESIARVLETMSAKDFLDEQLRTSPYLRKYYREAHEDEAPHSSTQPPLNGFEEERDTPDWVLGLPDKQFDAWLRTAALPQVNQVMPHINKAAQTATGEDRAVVLSRAMRIIGRFAQLAGPFSEVLIPAPRRRRRPTEREEGREAG